MSIRESLRGGSDPRGGLLARSQLAGYPRGTRASGWHVYEIVLREGGPEVLTSLVDGALLVDAWDELVLPRPIRAAWSGLIYPVHCGG